MREMSVDWESFRKRAREKGVSGRLPQTWKPAKEGEELVGVIVEAFPNPWDQSVTSYVIRTPNGEEYMTPRNQVLINLLSRFSPEVGDYIYIRYDGLGRSKPGRNPPKIFTVYVEKPGRQAELKPPAEPRAEELPPVQTAEEVREERAAPDPEALKRYLMELKGLYGDYIERNKFELLLHRKGWEISAEEAAEILPDVVEVKKYGVRIKG